MGILDEDVQRVRQEADFVAIASEEIGLKRVGQRWVGLCPFHAEKTPSFSINATENLFFCFGCQKSGDVITFVREIKHLDFVESVEYLASRTGIELRYDDKAVGADRQRHNRLVEAMGRAVEWYHQRLLTAPDARPARDYLRSRGYDGDVARAYKLGWAPDEWDALCRELKLPDDVLRDTGLGFVNKRDRRQDTFRARLLFPIFDVRGDPVAFGGRALGGDGPKYKNSPETALYSKSKVLYGLNWAKTEVVSSGEVIVCEGYTDVIGLAQAGLSRAVATCGTSLADEHFRMLKNFARRVVLAYDADAAGQEAAARFYAWERQYEVDIVVAGLPAGEDPADVARRDPAALKTAVEQARPFLAFRLERVLARADLRSPEGRAKAAEAGLDVIREHPNEIVREQYVGQLAVRCDLPAETLARALARGPRRGSGGGAHVEQAREPRRSAVGGPETEALKLAVHRPEEVAGRLDHALFGDETHADAYRALESADTLHDAIASCDPASAALLQQLAVEESDADADEVVARVADLAAARALFELETEAKESDDPRSYSAVTGWLKLTMERLREQEARVDAAAQLVAWLRDRVEEQEHA